MLKQFLKGGEIVSTHGIKGEVKVTHWCDNPEYLCQFKTLYLDNGKTTLNVLGARAHKSAVLLLLEGYEDINLAETLRGKTIYFNREDDPDKGTPFLEDYVGIEVVDFDTGKSYGRIKEVLFTGANDVYSLVDSEGVQRLVPAIPQVVIETDLENAIMKIRPLKGLFEDED